MTVAAVATGVITGGREETPDAGHQLDGRAQLQAQGRRQVGLGELREAGAVYQVVRENLGNTQGGLEAVREAARLAAHLGVVLAVVNLGDKLRHLLHTPVSQTEDLWCWRPRPGAGRPRLAGPLTLVSLVSLLSL